jgi:WD40 repeat protein
LSRPLQRPLAARLQFGQPRVFYRTLTIITALYRDETKLHTFRGSQASKSSIDVYSCSGKLIRRINWDKGSIKGLGWSEDEKLLVVTQDGTVRCYYNLQGDFSQFSLGHGAEEFGVVACR